MNTRTTFTIGLIAAIMSCFYCGVQGAQDAARQPALPFRAELRFFPPLDEQILDHWIDELTLSNAQSAMLSVFFEGYRRVAEEVMPQMQKLNTEAWRIGDDRRDDNITLLEYADIFEPMQAEAGRLRNALILAEEQLFLDMTPLLADEQLERLSHVRLARQREWYAVEFTALPGANIDMAALVDSLDLGRMEREAIRSTINEYTAKFVPLAKRRHDLVWVTRIQGIRHTGSATEYDEAFLDERRRRSKPRLDIDRNLRDLNRTYVKRIVASLPGELGRRLVDRYFAAAIPKYHPDARADGANMMLTSVLGNPLLDENQRAHITRLQREYWAAYDRARESLHDEEFAFMFKFQSTFSMNAHERQEHEETIQVLLSKLDELTSDILREVPKLLTEEQMAWFASQTKQVPTDGDQGEQENDESHPDRDD